MTDQIERLNTALEGRYRVERELGEGGMATVYLADDLKHGRKVAVKVLKHDLAAVVGAERFLAEIKTTARLQHPHILPLYDSGDASGFLYFVMPYVGGETLRERIDRDKQLPVGEAVQIAREVADALQTAHEQGVIHRDIKPANILLSSGHPLVADFGIALAISAAGGGRLTETGLSLGTPHYMSPEQATGDQHVGIATDVYALACVLYEMLVGEPPHTGSTAQAILGKIIQAEPASTTSARPSVPANVDAAIRKGLEKLPADRFGTARDFAEALGDPGFRHGADGAVAAGSAGEGLLHWKRIALGAVGTAAVLGAVLAAVVFAGDGRDQVVERHRVILGSGTAAIAGVNCCVALPRDGSGILYGDTIGSTGGGTTYWWKPHGRADAIRVPTMDGAIAPTFSPDGEWVAYLVGDELRKQTLGGGATVLLATDVEAIGAQALTWLDDGTLVFEGGSFILARVSQDGGPIDTLSTPAETASPTHVSGLLGGGGVLVSSCTDATCVANRLFLMDWEQDTVQTLADDVLRAWHVPGGQVVYVDRRGAVFAAGLIREELRLGPPVPLFDGVAVNTFRAAMQMGDDGTVLYLRGPSEAGGTPSTELAWVSRSGEATPVHPGWTFDPAGPNWGASLSPDGTRVALRIGADGNQDLWLKELDDGPITRLTFDEGLDWSPHWTPDGQSVTFTSNRLSSQDVWLRRGDGTGVAELLYNDERGIVEAIWTPDAESLLLRTGRTIGEADILAFRVGADSLATPLLAGDYEETQPAISPDGRWLAYVSTEAVTPQVFVRPFPDVNSGRWQVSTSGGIMPAWAHSGRELFFVDGTRSLVAVRIATESGFQIGEKEALFSLPASYVTSRLNKVYSVAPDDQRFLMARLSQSAGSEHPAGTVLIRNFFEELRQRAPG